MTKLTTSAVWVRGIADMLAAEGLDVPGLLAAAGIDVASLEAPGARLATEKISRLWELAVDRATRRSGLRSTRWCGLPVSTSSATR